MLRTSLCCALPVASAIAAAALAEPTEVVITVERSSTAVPSDDPPFKGHRPSVDVALLLDTSNSMDGLIAQAKTQLWSIVGQFAEAKKNGQTPALRVALFEYGNNGLPAAEGYLRQVVPLSDDLDKLSESLFALSTNGGDEYCGQVIDQAITRLDWSSEPNGYKAIFIAGNEPFTQGSVDYRPTCKRAIENGIVVNTIHCGQRSAGVKGKWAHGAELAEGDFFNIDQDRAVVRIPCPQDKVIIRLNAELNKTYLWYGNRDERIRYAENQTAQDANADALGVAAARAAVKASGGYANQRRDLVDALQADRETLQKLKPEQLPEVLQELAPAARLEHVERQAARRAELKQQIGTLAAERARYLSEKQAAAAENPNRTTLGAAVNKAVEVQLKARGFEVAAPAE